MNIHVKHVYVNGVSFFACAGGGYYVHTPYSMVEYSKGDKKLYYVGTKQTTKDECNKKYLELKHDCKHIKGKKFEREITEYDITMEELVNFCKQYGFVFQGSEINRERRVAAGCCAFAGEPAALPTVCCRQQCRERCFSVPTRRQPRVCRRNAQRHRRHKNSLPH